MSDISLVSAELQTPGTYGLNSITRVYTNPGGIDRSDPSALAAIQTNTALFAQRDISVYREFLDPPSEFWTIFPDGEAMKALAAGERDDFQAFVVPMISNGPIKNPELLLKDLVQVQIFTNGTTDPVVRDNYEALIKELKTVAEMIGANARQAVVVDAMAQLGWII